jgi:hypothetical protein
MSGDQLWYRTGRKNMIIFILIWWGGPFPELMLIKRVFNFSAYLYLWLIPWSFVGLVMLMRPQWLSVIAKKQERDIERLGKWTPPGFP